LKRGQLAPDDARGDDARARRTSHKVDLAPGGGLPALLRAIHGCTICSAHLPLGPRPLLQVDAAARILIIGQAPGRRAHETGTPFNDPSGDRLRAWMGVTPLEFYDPRLTAIVPMGFCFPGAGISGDLPPRPECAPTWHEALLGSLTKVRLTLIVGQYSLERYAPAPAGRPSVSNYVSNWERTWPDLIPLPHPSWRNNGWVRKHPWFQTDLVPSLQASVRQVLSAR
jgi:uracil-DNA glycosylase